MAMSFEKFRGMARLIYQLLTPRRAIKRYTDCSELGRIK
jgi:hypothetical protein